MTKKRIFIILLIILLVISGILFFVFHHKKNRENVITGEEWFYKEYAFVKDMQALCEQLDLIVSLYYNGNINEESYLEQITVIKQEMVLFLADYEKTKNEYEIELGTHTVASKMGSEAAEKSFYKVSDLIDNCLNEEYYKDREKLAYMYIAYGKEIEKNLYTFAASLTSYLEEDFIELWEYESQIASETDAVTEGE